MHRLVRPLLVCCLSLSLLGAAEDEARDDDALAAAIPGELSAAELQAVHRHLGEAIAYGGQLYNAGAPQVCAMIYEGMGYQILHRYGERSASLHALLEGTLDEVLAIDEPGQYPNVPAHKAWRMRQCFDRLLALEPAGGGETGEETGGETGESPADPMIP